jgi:hypothetical protein
MYPKGKLNAVRYCTLGALNGWLFGTLAWWLNELHVNDMSKAAPSEVSNSPEAITCLAEMFPPNYGEVVILCMLTFAMVSYGVHRALLKRPLSLLLLWQVIGLLSLALLLILAELRWGGDFFSPLNGWILLLGFGAALVSSFIIGVIVESAAQVYPCSKNENGG